MLLNTDVWHRNRQSTTNPPDSSSINIVSPILAPTMLLIKILLPINMCATCAQRLHRG